MRPRKIYKYKTYSHFDNRKDYQNWINYITDPCKIEKHGFYPFIHYILKSWKYDNQKHDTKTKPRDINYAAHIDRYIYEYYNEELNKKYNEYAKENGINQCAVVYRNNLHKNNIQIAKEAFCFLKGKDDFYISIADFSKYFDKIDHAYLKNCLEEVLGAVRLSNDWYKVFRSITKYCSIDLVSIAKEKGLNLREVRKLKRISTIEELHNLKSGKTINTNRFGIPQGSSISSTLSNINLIKYDKLLNQFVTTRNGFYRRYCDDSIIIIPIKHREEFISFYISLNNSIPGLELNNDKVNQYSLKNNQIVDQKGNNTRIKYLGFEFNGQTIRIREKTVTSFFLKAYRSIDGINRISKKYKRNAYRKQFYQSFTHLGNNHKKRTKGNFLTYVEKCSKILEEPMMIKQVAKHWPRFEERLNKNNQ